MLAAGRAIRHGRHGDSERDGLPGMTRHYRTLDGVRGIAAIAVVCMHADFFLTPIALPRAYLAVDLFFLLSGLVIAHAYGRRLDAGMGLGAFLKLRLVRLYPLYLLGTLIGIAFYLAGTRMGTRGTLSFFETLSAMAAGLLMLPSPVRIFDEHWLTPFNFAGWSLMFELAVNMVMAAIWVRLRSPGLLWAIILVSAAALFWSILRTGTADLGPGLDSLGYAIPRTSFSFFLGIALHRMPQRPPVETRWAWAVPLALLPFFAVAREAGPLVDLVCIFLIFPLAIHVGAWLEPRNGRIFALLGTLSFAIYALHSPLLPIANTATKLAGTTPAALAPWGGIELVLLLALIALLADRWLDRPVRRWLGRMAGTPRSNAA